MPMTDQKPGNDEPALQKKRKLGRWRHEPTGNTADLDEGTYFSASTGHTSRLVMLSVRDIVGQPDWTRIPDDEPPAVSDVDWTAVGESPPERVRPPREDCDGYTPENVGFIPVGFAVHRGDGVVWANLIHGSGEHHIVAHYDMTGHLTHRRKHGEMVSVVEVLDDIRPALPTCAHCGDDAMDYASLTCEACSHRAESCPECGDRKVTGMGSCSLCCSSPSLRPPPPPPPAILRRLPNGRLSLRLEVLSPTREVAKGQVKLALNLLSDVCCLHVNSRLDSAFLDLWFAVTNHYPRRRHLREIEAAFVEYVKAQEDAPKKPEGDAQDEETKDEAEEGMP